MGALPDLITVEQLRNLPDDGRKYELHHGEVVPMTRPTSRHFDEQEWLVELLRKRLGPSWRVSMEFPYRPIAEFDLRVADVVVVSQARSRTIDPDDNLNGAPELVIDVKSPSNTQRQLAELSSLCLANGSLEFWVVDLDRFSVTVIHRDGTTTVYVRGQSIPLTPFGGEDLPVDEDFA